MKRLFSDTHPLKKLLVLLLYVLISLNLFAQIIPEKLAGIWESKDRYIFFEQSDEEGAELVVLLKTYYGWYLDRAAEPAAYSEEAERDRNTATARQAESIKIQNIDVKSTQNSLYGSLDLFYSKNQSNTIPFFILNDNFYLNYFEKDSNDNHVENAGWNFYRGIAPSKGFLVSSQTVPSNISGYIIDGEKLYDVRYWQTYMNFSDDYITFTYNNDSYQIPKHITSCNANYSCVTGQSKKVRNPVKPFPYKTDDYIFNDDASAFTKNEEPYLKRLTDKKGFEDLMQIVKAANARRKPDAPALFPENNLDWHWDLIDILEKDNWLIQQVRTRQKEFGPRGRDIGK